MPAAGEFILRVNQNEAGVRLDAFVAGHLPLCSRSMAAHLIHQGLVRVEGIQRKPSYKVKSFEQVSGRIPPPATSELTPEPMPLTILFEDRALIVINKPAGLVVHPAAGHDAGTLVHGLLHHCPDLEGIGGEQRPGIVHRLDKDTSGVLVVAKSAQAHHCLAEQFKQRRIAKTYLALVKGVPETDRGRIDLPVGRHPIDRKKMSTVSPTGREASTFWRVRERFDQAALLAIDLKTGRTHQIRVHCQAMGHPIVGDPLYGQRRALSRLAHNQPSLYQVLKGAQRQMLHAFRLGFIHPLSGESLSFEAPIPEDMVGILNALRTMRA